MHQPTFVIFTILFRGQICRKWPKLQSWAKYFKQNREIQQNQTGKETFDIYFCVFFDCYCHSLISGRETRHMSPPEFEIFLIFPISFSYKILSLKSSTTRLALAYQVCYTRYHVSFYLWLIRSVLKRCKVQKYYDKDCSFWLPSLGGVVWPFPK